MLTPRLHQMINDLFADSHGIDYEKLYRCFLSAHDLTGTRVQRCFFLTDSCLMTDNDLSALREREKD